jgi:hypothetical protein
MLLAIITAAAEGAAEHGSKTPFYIAAGGFACWAVLVGVIGVTQPAFPRGAGGQRLVMAISGVLMVCAMATAVITSS